MTDVVLWHLSYKDERVQGDEFVPLNDTAVSSQVVALRGVVFGELHPCPQLGIHACYEEQNSWTCSRMRKQVSVNITYSKEDVANMLRRTMCPLFPSADGLRWRYLQ